MKKLTCISLSIILFFTIIISANAQAPQGMNYQAVARNTAGSILANQNVGVQITITNGSGGTILYLESHNTTTNQFGLFTLNIGSGIPGIGTFSSITWATVAPWMEVGLDPTGGTAYVNMGTSQLLSVPYSLYSATSADWTRSGNEIYNNNSGLVGIGNNAPFYGKLHITPSGGLPGIYVDDPFDATILSGTKSGILEGIYISKTNPTSSTAAIYGVSAGYGAAVEGLSNGGGYGVTGTSPTGTGVYGNSTSGSGVYGTSASGNGLYGYSTIIGANGFATGAGAGITAYYGGSFSEVVGVYGKAAGTSGATGLSYGVVGEATGSTTQYNAGVYGYASGSTGANQRNWGVMGISDDATNGCGIYGLGYGAAQSRGVEGDVFSGNPQIGVYAYTAGVGASDYAGYFYGLLHANSATASVKAFKIDHPADPANKFLYHSSVESNDMMNIYNGNVTTDANGDAVVSLPSYFEILNKDFKYSLTCIGTFAQAIVMNEVKDNQFSIKTDKPNVKVSWMVTGVRHDPVADKYRIVNEVEKNSVEKGKYLMPDVYGLPMSSSINPPMGIEKGVKIHEVMNKQIAPPVALPKEEKKK